MKSLLFISVTLFFISCQKENKSNLQKIKEQLETINLTSYTFILKNDTLIEGKMGTRIMLPKDIFSNYTNGEINLELKEFYTKEAIILNGLSTVTNKDELLETSGMFYINFTENGKQLLIQKDKSYQIYLPKKPLINSNIYFNDNDSIFKWNLTSSKIKTYIPDILKNYFYGLTTNQDGLGGFFKETTTDSVQIVRKQDSIKLKQQIIEHNTKLFNDNQQFYTEIGAKLVNGEIKYNEDKKTIKFYATEDELYNFTYSKLGWINIDKVLNYEIEKNFTFHLNNSFDRYSLNIIYLDSDSYINEYISNNSNKIPIKLRGKIKLVIYSNDETTIYYDKLYIDKNSKTNIDINLKPISITKLKEVLVNPN
ncbi:hypothetical protein [Flavobacterium sp.]|uniref:hypothetical protein n=1 Tax=Flavobacterium sp. TaxID=239 RepID=UPI0035284779